MGAHSDCRRQLEGDTRDERPGNAALAAAGGEGGSGGRLASMRPARTGPNNQRPRSALPGFSQSRAEPVKIRAASLEIRDKDNIATFTGEVYVLQGDTEMRCKVLVVSYEAETGTRLANGAAEGTGAGDRQVRQIEAKGDVVVVQKDQTATGDA